MLEHQADIGPYGTTALALRHEGEADLLPQAGGTVDSSNATKEELKCESLQERRRVLVAILP